MLILNCTSGISLRKRPSLKFSIAALDLLNGVLDIRFLELDRLGNKLEKVRISGEDLKV